MSAYRSLCIALTLALLAIPFAVIGWRDELIAARDPLLPHRLGEPIAGAVLVVGDGTAFGLGVEHRETWAVRTASEGGDRTAARLHSRDALRQLPQWLAEVRPQKVFLCLGADDAVLQPVRWRPEEKARIETWLDEEVQAFAGTPPFVGRFRFGDAIVELSNGGAAQVGGQRGTWRSEGDRLQLLVDGVVRVEWRYRVVREVVTLTDLDGNEVGTLEPEWFRADPLTQVRIAAERGDHGEARLRAEALRSAEHPDAAAGLAWARFVGGYGDGVPTEAFSDPPQLAERGAEALALSLERCVRICRRYGAQVVIVGHPERFAAVDAVAKPLAERLGVEFVAPSDASVLPLAPGYWDTASHERLAAELASR